ncbi:hypothetical protein VCHE48_0581 [Vibrio cholerae HE48]|nr:hypothetical protein VCHE48_0581 [Vibrio cholerae HE48]
MVLILFIDFNEIFLVKFTVFFIFLENLKFLSYKTLWFYFFHES